MAIPLQAKAVFFFSAAVVVIALFLLVPAGTLDYWQAWMYMAILFIPMTFIAIYFLAKDPEFLERRFRLKERVGVQSRLIRIAQLIFFFGFLIPGLDRRFGWSSIPAEVSITAGAVVFISYMFIFWVFKVNSYASRVVEVEKGQKVITTGPYAIVRHPMYFGTVFLYLATPIALGSWWALPPFLLTILVLIPRILDEEKLLRKELKGYKEYCKKVRYRLIPFVW